MSLTLIQDIKTKSSYDYDARKKVETLEKKAVREYVKEILKELKDTFIRHNVKYIIGTFSGGNDDGGFDDVYLANDKSEEIILKDEFEIKRDFRFFVDKKNIYRFNNEKAKKISVFYTITNSEKNLLDVLEDTLYSTGALEEYGSFAGEFSVTGTVKLDVFNYTWERDGQESVETYERNYDDGTLSSDDEGEL